MNKAVWIYLKYVLIAAVMMVGYAVFYSVSVAMFFFLIGAFMLPVVVIAFPILLYKVWEKVMRPIENKVGKILLLIISYIIYMYITYRLDSYVSWSKEGNLRSYLSLFGF